MNKKVLIAISGSLIVLVLGGAAVFTALKLQEKGVEPVAPNAPQSQPKAQTETLPSNPIELTFGVTGGSTPPSSAPSSTPATPSAPAQPASSAPSSTPAAGGPAASTATPKPSSAPAASSAPKETLPQAGTSLPTILGITGGAILLVVGLLLAL